MLNHTSVVPFHTYIWKVTSRCNLNCTYCFVYNSADSLWRKQPVLMSIEVARQAALRIRDHCIAHEKPDATIIFHGGEPLLGGLDHLKNLFSVLSDVSKESGIRFTVGMQSNGLLFTKEIGDFFLEVNASIGISLDGPPAVNDIHRVNRKGEAVSHQLNERLTILRSPRYKSIFSGFLCVINIETDPVEVTDYLLSLEPPTLDYLLPLDNYVHRPQGKEKDIEASPYGDWLIRAFEHWLSCPNKTRIRFFESIIDELCGVSSSVESIGTTPVDLVVVETNGDIEAVDSLKSTFEGATQLGYNIFDDDFDTVARDFRVKERHLGVQSLSNICQECSLVKVCGGGYLPHRYSKSRNFDNPSIYCSDLTKIIQHVHERVAAEIKKRTLDNQN